MLNIGSNIDPKIIIMNKLIPIWLNSALASQKGKKDEKFYKMPKILYSKNKVELHIGEYFLFFIY